MNEPGRELDALVAEKVIGLQVYQATEDDMIFTLEREFVQAGDYCYDVENHMTRLVPSYSTDIAAAWQVVEHFGSDCRVDLTKYAGDHGYHCFISRYTYDDEHYLGDCEAPTAPHAICLAALAAVGADV